MPKNKSLTLFVKLAAIGASLCDSSSSDKAKVLCCRDWSVAAKAKVLEGNVIWSQYTLYIFPH